MSILKTTARAAASLAALGAITAISPASRPAAAADKASGEQCLSTSLINGFNAADDHTLYVDAGVNDVYRFDLAPGCNDLAFKETIGLKSVPPGDPWICDALQAEVVYRDLGMPQRCQVDAMHKLTKAEVAALNKHGKP